MNMKDNSSNMLVSDSIVDDVSDADAIIFDCDGVLIDARLSYDLAIKNTISLILGNLISTKLDSNIIPNQII